MKLNFDQININKFIIQENRIFSCLETIKGHNYNIYIWHV
jgi:hypothetical protein